jgi:membrane protein DedA with SNARE-associated domain
MSFESFVEAYGYWALVFGTFLEGETILIIGGFLAHRGYLSLPWVVLAAFVGSLCGDQVYFLMGRKKGHSLLQKRPWWQANLGRVSKFMSRNQTLLILGFRFFYGLRTIIPFVLGISPVRTARFVLLNSVGALVWAVVVGTAGYLFGTTLEALMGRVDLFERQVIMTIAATGIVIWAFHTFRKRRNPKT